MIHRFEPSPELPLSHSPSLSRFIVRVQLIRDHDDEAACELVSLRQQWRVCKP